MGLDNFTSEDSKGGGSQSSDSKSSDSSSNADDSTSSSQNDPYKRVGVGNHVKVFHTEDDWERTVDYLENEMGFDIDEVLSWKPQYTHKALHVAIINSKGIGDLEFEVTKECMVCGHIYNFPHDWDFVTYKEEPVCPDHEYQEIIKANRENKVS